MDFKKTFGSKRVFLTGHTGFKGSWMTIWLQMMGATVKGYALKPEKESLFNMIRPKLDIESVIADIRNAEKLKKEILSFKPDFIFHFAAQPLVRESYAKPVETFEVNVMGTINLLESLKFYSKTCICVIATTDKVYQNIEKNYAYKETDKLGGHDPYSASKAATEIAIESFRLSFFNPDNFSTHKKSIATGRAGNVIGGGDFAKDRIVPDIFKSLRERKKVSIRNPLAIRPWQHVLEPLNGYLTLAAKMKSNPVKFASSFNFGPLRKDAFSVKDLVKLSMESWKAGSFEIAKEKKKVHEAGLLMLNINKAGKELNWRPVWNGKTAISKTIHWYKKSLSDNQDAFQLCEDDIREYIRKFN
jgi:CDP-glucose 4,6-dehydratase